MQYGRLFPIYFWLSPNQSLPLVSCNSTIDDYQVWQKRLAHPNSNVLHDILKSSFLGNKHTSSLNYFPLSNSFILMFKPNSLLKLKKKISNNGGEHTSYSFQEFLQSNGIISQRYAHQPHNKMG
ncbi:hypothetical protein CR513_53380, partial [Mucuna pruriens]